MSTPLTSADITPRDRLLLRDLVRFGVLTDDQIARRLAPATVSPRLQRLLDGELVERWPDLIEHTRLYSATPRGAALVRCGVRLSRPSLEHLRHDIAVVDLADALRDRHPGAHFFSERQAGRLLRQRPTGGPQPTVALPGAHHRPDGLLVIDGKRLAIELEHSDKGDGRYAGIFRWFALNVRVDGVRWYVDDERIIARLQRVAAQYGFAQDVDVSYAPFPPGVVMRHWVRR